MAADASYNGLIPGPFATILNQESPEPWLLDLERHCKVYRKILRAFSHNPRARDYNNAWDLLMLPNLQQMCFRYRHRHVADHFDEPVYFCGRQLTSDPILSPNNRVFVRFANKDSDEYKSHLATLHANVQIANIFSNLRGEFDRDGGFIFNSPLFYSVLEFETYFSTAHKQLWRYMLLDVLPEEDAYNAWWNSDDAGDNSVDRCITVIKKQVGDSILPGALSDVTREVDLVCRGLYLLINQLHQNHVCHLNIRLHWSQVDKRVMLDTSDLAMAYEPKGMLEEVGRRKNKTDILARIDLCAVRDILRANLRATESSLRNLEQKEIPAYECKVDRPVVNTIRSEFFIDGYNIQNHGPLMRPLQTICMRRRSQQLVANLIIQSAEKLVNPDVLQTIENLKNQTESNDLQAFLTQWDNCQHVLNKRVVYSEQQQTAIEWIDDNIDQAYDAMQKLRTDR